jgi:hypothetical protein
MHNDRPNTRMTRVLLFLAVIGIGAISIFDVGWLPKSSVLTSPLNSRASANTADSRSQEETEDEPPAVAPPSDFVPTDPNDPVSAPATDSEALPATVTPTATGTSTPTPTLTVRATATPTPSPVARIFSTGPTLPTSTMLFATDRDGNFEIYSMTVEPDPIVSSMKRLTRSSRTRSCRR